MTTQVGSEENPLACYAYAAGTDVGLRREENQDSFGVIENGNFKFYIVADGMGGVKGGAVASSLAVETMRECLEHRDSIGVEHIVSAVSNSNTAIFEKGVDDPGLSGMGTTLVGLAFVGPRLYVTNVGDSRAYRVRQGKIKQLTEDHTLVMELVRTGAITEEQAEDHPVAHMLTRSLGPTPSVDVDCWLDGYGPARGDRYLLCSDGLYNLVSDKEIQEHVESKSLDQGVEELIKLANQRGGTDNITIIIVEVGEGFAIGPEEFAEEVDDTIEIEVPEEVIAAGAKEEPLTNGEHQDGSAEAEKRASQKADQTEKEEAEEKEAATSAQERLRAKLDSGAETAQTDTEEQTTQTAAEQAAASEALEKTGSRRSILLGLAFVIIASIFGMGYFWGSMQQSEVVVVKPAGPDSRIVSAPVPYQAVLAPVKVGADSSDSDYIEKPEPIIPLGGDTVSVAFDTESSVKEVTGEMINGLTLSEVRSISRRKARLRGYIANAREDLKAFDEPLTGKLAADLQKSARRQAELKKSREEVTSEIDAANRKIQVWYGRMQRFESGDPINVASEVAPSSSKVRQAKEIFQNSTYEYLKEAEVLRYNPSNAKQEARVSRLAKMRRKRLRELKDITGKEIQDVIKASNRKIAEATSRKDKVESELDQLEKRNGFIRVLLGDDPRLKRKKREELLRDLDIHQRELDELNELLPRSKELD